MGKMELLFSYHTQNTIYSRLNKIKYKNSSTILTLSWPSNPTSCRCQVAFVYCIGLLRGGNEKPDRPLLAKTRKAIEMQTKPIVKHLQTLIAALNYPLEEVGSPKLEIILIVN
jgi:hypothetical protein